jgi:PAT family beta-lactamase induction signal transducer AmpG
MALSLTTPFMMDLGFSRTQIGTVTKGFGMVATIVGSLAGGIWMAKISINHALWIFGFFQAVCNLSFMLLAHLGHNNPMMVTAIGIENFCNGMGNVAFSAFLMSLCDKRFTATQFALLTSLMALTRVVVGAPTGFLAKNLGWETYFLVCTLAAAPGMYMLSRFAPWPWRRAAAIKV